jgi:hypothetical protein
MTTLAIVGGGELANAINIPATIFTHSEYDITDESECVSLSAQLASFDTILITVGYHGTDDWNSWMVNTVGPSYLVSLLERNYSGKKIIVVTSYGGAWPSWPGITLDRLTYNSSKSACTNFLSGLIHSGTKNKITILETSKFQSNMSNNTGMDIASVANQISDIISTDLHIMRVQFKE